MNKKRRKRLLRQAINEHSIEDYVKRLPTPGYQRAMERVGRRRFCAEASEDDKKKAVNQLDKIQEAGAYDSFLDAR